MKRTKRSKRVKRSIFDIKSYILVFFGVFAGCTLCSMLVLRGLYPDLSPIGIGKLEILGDILAISLGYTLIVLIYRGITIENPTRRILSATEKIGKGDFTVKIKPINKGRRTNEYDVIIEDLNKMVTELSAIETLRSDFVATVSHELKTPLAVVQNYCMLLQNPDITETERTQYVQSITSATKRLTELPRIPTVLQCKCLRMCPKLTAIKNQHRKIQDLRLKLWIPLFQMMPHRRNIQKYLQKVL